jgi:hypothetical protein
LQRTRIILARVFGKEHRMSISAISAVSPAPLTQATPAATPGAFQQALASTANTPPAGASAPQTTGSAPPAAPKAHHHGGHGHGGAASSSQASTLLSTLSGLSSGSVDISV